MSVATIRLGRRSKELMNMTLAEINEAEKKEIDGKTIHIVNVVDQKNLKTGEAAPVVFSDPEFQVLQIYLSKMRPKITGDAFNQTAFPSQQQRASSHNMSFGSFYNILQKLESKSGKKISSRTVRGSKITINRSLNVSDSSRRHLAKAMSHSVATANRYYDHSDVSKSVVETLTLDHANASSTVNTSGAIETEQTFEKSVDNASGNSSGEVNVDQSFVPTDQITSTPIKGASAKRSAELDVTLKNLRNKKVKLSSDEREVQLNFLNEQVTEIVDRMIGQGTEASLMTSTGQVSIAPVTAQLSKGVTKTFSTKDIRDVIKKCIDPLAGK